MIVATADGSSGALPITSTPSRKVTVPSAGAGPAGAATTAVYVTRSPYVDGLMSAVRVVSVASSVTVSRKSDEPLAA